MKGFFSRIWRAVKWVLRWTWRLLLIATVCYVFAEFAPSARQKLPNFYWAIDQLYAVLNWFLGLIRQLVEFIQNLFT